MSAGSVTEVPMPQMGVAVTEGVIVAWHVSAGDEVAAEQPLCDIATDKVDTEVVAPVAGVVAEIVAAVGETVAVGDPVARMAPAAGAAGTTPSAESPVNGGKTARPAPQSAGDTAALPDQAASAPPGPARPVSETLAGAAVDPAAAADAAVARPRADGAPLSSPVARRFAAEHRIDLSEIKGSGRRGRIRKADVLAALEAGKAAPPGTSGSEAAPPSATATAPRLAAGPGDGAIPRGYEDVPHEIVKTSPQRRAISEHMIRSRQTAAHMTTEVEVDMHAVSNVRGAINTDREGSGRRRVSFLSFIARAAIVALRDHPALNATFQHEHSVQWREVNLGIAVDAPGGLIVPVIRSAERLTVDAIADAIADVGERARARKLVPDDLRAGTFTISNPGSVGAVSAPAIINQPQVAILGTPAIVQRPWVITTPDGAEAIVPRPIMKLALTFDHRAVDGADATRYVVLVKRYLETWDAQAYL